jgi:YD repeat-containing protein
MRGRIVLLSILLMALILGSGLSDISIQTGSSMSGANALGFEPWFYYVGGVVNSANGNLYFTATDISFKARGFTVEFIRAYNSLGNGTRTGFGYGWTFNYNVFLIDSGSTVCLVEGDGSAHDFTNTGNGSYSSPAGVYSRLTKNLDGSFVLWFKDGSRYVFSPTGNLTSVLDKNENHLWFNYTSGKLTDVADDSGLTLTIDYDAQDRITSIVDPLTRQISYEYDSSDNLIGVVDAMGYHTSYFYGDNHEIEAIVNPLGRVLTFSYIATYYGDKVSTIGNSQTLQCTGLCVSIRDISSSWGFCSTPREIPDRSTTI